MFNCWQANGFLTKESFLGSAKKIGLHCHLSNLLKLVAECFLVNRKSLFRRDFRRRATLNLLSRWLCNWDFVFQRWRGGGFSRNCIHLHKVVRISSHHIAFRFRETWRRAILDWLLSSLKRPPYLRQFNIATYFRMHFKISKWSSLLWCCFQGNVLLIHRWLIPRLVVCFSFLVFSLSQGFHSFSVVTTSLSFCISDSCFGSKNRFLNS